MRMCIVHMAGIAANHVALLITHRIQQGCAVVFSPSFLKNTRNQSEPKCIWRFPEMGVPLVLIHLRLGFSSINQPAIGNSP